MYIPKTTCIIGSAIGLIVGSCIAFIKDKKKGVLYSFDELNQQIDWNLLGKISGKSDSSWQTFIELLAKDLTKNTRSGDIGVIPIGDLSDNQLNTFTSKLENVLNGRKVIATKNILETKECSTQVLLATNGIITKSQLDQLKQNLSIQGTQISGWIFIDPELEI